MEEEQRRIREEEERLRIQAEEMARLDAISKKKRVTKKVGTRPSVKMTNSKLGIKSKASSPS
jgi:hypothetical protein